MSEFRCRGGVCGAVCAHGSMFVEEAIAVCLRQKFGENRQKYVKKLNQKHDY